MSSRSRATSTIKMWLSRLELLFNCLKTTFQQCLLSIEWNPIRPGGSVHRIVTKLAHKTLPWGGRGPGVQRCWVGGLGGGRLGVSSGISRFHSIDLLTKIWLLHFLFVLRGKESLNMKSTCFRFTKLSTVV